MGGSQEPSVICRGDPVLELSPLAAGRPRQVSRGTWPPEISRRPAPASHAVTCSNSGAPGLRCVARRYYGPRPAPRTYGAPPTGRIGPQADLLIEVGSRFPAAVDSQHGE